MEGCESADKLSVGRLPGCHFGNSGEEDCDSAAVQFDSRADPRRSCNSYTHADEPGWESRAKGNHERMNRAKRGRAPLHAGLFLTSSALALAVATPALAQPADQP